MKKILFLSLLIIFFTTISAKATLLAHYPLANNGTDITGLNDTLSLVNAPFQNGGVYCNGVYSGPSMCKVLTPKIKNFIFDSFVFSCDFMVTEYLNQPVLIAGRSWRWLGITLLADGTLRLLYNNNSSQSSTTTFELNQWYNSAITYDGTRIRLYLKGVLACFVDVTLAYSPADTEFGITNFSNGTTFKGFIKNIKIGDSPTAIQDASEPGLLFYPNPVNDIMVIEGIGPGAGVIIYNCSGQRVLVFEKISRTADVSSLSPGLYFIETRNNKQIYRKAFMKK